jgi:hypothetical protein
MTAYTHVPKKMKNKIFLRYRLSHVEIDCNEKKAPKMTNN